MGLSTGVHLLNLLAIPAIVMVVYFKNTMLQERPFQCVLFFRRMLLGIRVYMVIPELYGWHHRFELVFVNGRAALH
jgi:hypothetical protein